MSTPKTAAMRSRFGSRLFRILAALSAVCLGGCIGGPVSLPPLERPDVAPHEKIEETRAYVDLDASVVGPIHKELLPIDLPTVVRVAMAQNMDIERAKARVEAAQGQLQSKAGLAFPVFSPTLLFERVHGSVRATPGDLTHVGFQTFQPYMLVQWIVNPGKVIKDVVAARKRLLSARYEERAVLLRTLQAAVNGYYSLAAAQARVRAESQTVAEAEEFLRISRARAETGAGLRTDESRALASLAGRQQDLLKALQEFYDASVGLALTLHIDARVTLVPNTAKIEQIQLVRDTLDIDDLVAIAILHRDDLQSIRFLAEAASAERGAAWWGGLGPQVQQAYQHGGITGHAEDVDRERDKSFDLSGQQRATSTLGWRFGVSTIGDLKVTKASERKAILAAKKRLDEVKAEVVLAVQGSRTNGQLINKARQQLQAAEESLKLARSSLEAGTMTALDVLQAQSTVAQARLRYSSAVLDYNQVQVDLLSAIGLLHEDAVLLPGERKAEE